MSEAWLEGPVEGVPEELQPAAHAMIDAVADIESAVAGLTPAQLWLTPGGAASLGFHLRHVPGSAERLLTYARDEALTPEQLAAIPGEGDPGLPLPGLDPLLARLHEGLERALEAYRTTDPQSLPDARGVGRARLPSTVRGLLYHVAEHSRRHAGQVVATARIIRGLGLGPGAQPRS